MELGRFAFMTFHYNATITCKSTLCASGWLDQFESIVALKQIGDLG